MHVKTILVTNSKNLVGKNDRDVFYDYEIMH